MAVQIDEIRATAERVAASHHLDLVDLEFQGGGKFRTLRIFIEKNAAERAKLAEQAASRNARTARRASRSRCSPASPTKIAPSSHRTSAPCSTSKTSSPAPSTPSKSPHPGSNASSISPKTSPGFKAVSSSFRPSLRSTRTGNGKAASPNSQTASSTIDLSAVKQKGKAKKAATESDRRHPLRERRKGQSGRRDLARLSNRNWQHIATASETMANRKHTRTFGAE